jgi:hypothetical protein
MFVREAESQFVWFDRTSDCPDLALSWKRGHGGRRQKELAPFHVPMMTRIGFSEACNPDTRLPESPIMRDSGIA